MTEMSLDLGHGSYDDTLGLVPSMKTERSRSLPDFTTTDAESRIVSPHRAEAFDLQ